MLPSEILYEIVKHMDVRTLLDLYDNRYELGPIGYAIGDYLKLRNNDDIVKYLHDRYKFETDFLSDPGEFITYYYLSGWIFTDRSLKRIRMAEELRNNILTMNSIFLFFDPKNKFLKESNKYIDRLENIIIKIKSKISKMEHYFSMIPNFIEAEYVERLGVDL
jgi:hypothetical protein